MAQVGDLLRNSRTNRGMTQEQAVQLLPYDLRTLQAYEQNERKETPWQAIAVIAQAYGDKRLLFQALQQNEAWQACLPAIKTRSLSEAGCTMLDELLEASKYHQPILHIIRDGAVSVDEQATWADAKARLYMLLASIIELLMADGQMDCDLMKELEDRR